MGLCVSCTFQSKRMDPWRGEAHRKTTPSCQLSWTDPVREWKLNGRNRQWRWNMIKKAWSPRLHSHCLSSLDPDATQCSFTAAFGRWPKSVGFLAVETCNRFPWFWFVGFDRFCIFFMFLFLFRSYLFCFEVWALLASSLPFHLWWMSCLCSRRLSASWLTLVDTYE